MLVNTPRIVSTLIADYLESSPSHGIQLCIDSPTLQFSDAVGFTERGDSAEREAITTLHPMRIASNTKTFVAVVALRLYEQGKLDLDASIEPHLLTSHRTLLQQSAYNIAAIAPRQLLNHTSGLFDYADSAAFMHAFVNTPKRHWTRSEQLQLAMTEGKPYGESGEVFRYSDTGYILLGEIIEHITQQDLGPALRSLINYKKLGLRTTWLESVEPIPEGALPLVHQYEGDLDTYDLDASSDIYGGGGLVSTVGDMALFMRGLFEGKIFEDSTTLNTMLAPVSAKRGGPDYGIWQQVPGIYRLGIDAGRDNRVFSHKGHFGTLAAYVPELEMAISFSLNYSRQGKDSDYRDKLLGDILALFDINP